MALVEVSDRGGEITDQFLATLQGCKDIVMAAGRNRVVQSLFKLFYESCGYICGHALCS
jgi:hypothetical protein